jgi:sugar phosphate isomerase/epimerase
LYKPFRLGVSGSCFVYAMSEELRQAAHWNAVANHPVRLDDRQNRMMADFMRDLMSTLNTMDIDAMECYHSTTWDKDQILDVLLDQPQVEFWSVHAPFGRYLDPASPEREAREAAIAAYKDAVDVASRIGARVVVAHPGSNAQYDMPKLERLKLSVDSIADVAELAGRLGISVAVEPLPKQEPGNSLDEVLWIIDKIALPNVGVNFDVNHLFPPEDIPGLIRKAGDRILSVHVSDQDGQERLWLPFMGTLDWAEVLTALVDTGYRGPLMYETHVQEVSSCQEVGRRIVENYRRLALLLPDSVIETG